ncbi:MAG: TIGR03118 family protein [Verrucomicrobia bacterium]|nr:MAG: TIGR03118 family protein [Verrucomicrobiota bacterium]
MKRKSIPRNRIMKNTSRIFLLILVLVSTSATAQYVQTNLVGYQPGIAFYTDRFLNGWGMDTAPDGSFCVANTATGKATFYAQSSRALPGKPLPLIITIPPAPSQPFGPVGTPTGVAYNRTNQFVISAHGRTAPARFLFDTLDGTISGWNPEVDPTHAIIVVDNSAEQPFPASYTALLLGRNSHGKAVLYAADSGNGPDISNNRIDMFGGQFQTIGSFTDPTVATQYPGNTVFQVEDVDEKIFVTFAGFAAPFGGIVDIFDVDGNLLTPNHFAANAGGQGPLVNPWPIAKAPNNFGKFSGAILIGNVEDGRINAFNQSGDFLGTLRHKGGEPIVIPGLWEFIFKQNADCDCAELFFTAGVNAVDFAGNGLFGIISAADKNR